jgi:hypothetical protein
MLAWDRIGRFWPTRENFLLAAEREVFALDSLGIHLS